METSDAHLKGDGKTQQRDEKPVADRQLQLEEARALVREYVPEGRSLADELIQERRKAAKCES